MTRVIHTGDTHLGYRQYHSPERRRDFLTAFRRVVEDAIDEDVDAVVHAGDLFHDRSPALADVHGAIRVLRDLRDADIPFLAVVGNHERTRDGQWIDLFQTLGLATRLDEGPTTVGDVALYGLDYVPPSRRDTLAYDFEPHDVEFAALVAHGPFDPFVPEVRTDRWDLPAVLASATVDFDAALLGDDHTPDTAQIGETWATYCGSTERVDASERDDRGYNVVEFEGDVRISRRGLETRRFVVVDLALAEGEGIERVRDRLREEDVEAAVVVVGIDGEGEDVPPARVEEFVTEEGALIARVTDRRDVETAESVPAVNFADPDEAVRDRVRSMGLSDAAGAIDSVVRDERIADANVRDRVRERIEALVEDDPDAFDPPSPGGSTGGERMDESTAAGEGAPGVAIGTGGGSTAAGSEDADTGTAPATARTADSSEGSERGSIAEGPGTNGTDRPDADAEAGDGSDEASDTARTAGGGAPPDDPDDHDDPDDPDDGEGATTIEDFL